MLDTNILISIIIFDSQTLKNMFLRVCEKYTLVLSTYVINELYEVVDRKFANKRIYLDEFLYKIPYVLEHTPEYILDDRVLKIRDVKDAPVLYSAIISDVDVLITGDKDFDEIKIERPEIMTATEFLKKY